MGLANGMSGETTEHIIKELLFYGTVLTRARAAFSFPDPAIVDAYIEEQLWGEAWERFVKAWAYVGAWQLARGPLTPVDQPHDQGIYDLLKSVCHEGTVLEIKPGSMPEYKFLAGVIRRRHSQASLVDELGEKLAEFEKKAGGQSVAMAAAAERERRQYLDALAEKLAANLKT